MNDGRVMFSARIPEELKELVNADQRTNEDVVEAALWREFGGERKGALQRRVEEKQRRISMIESEKNERQRELEEERQELEALQSKLESSQTVLEMEIEECLKSFGYLPEGPSDPAIENKAEKANVTPERFYEELTEAWDDA